MRLRHKPVILFGLVGMSVALLAALVSLTAPAITVRASGQPFQLVGPVWQPPVNFASEALSPVPEANQNGQNVLSFDGLLSTAVANDPTGLAMILAAQSNPVPTISTLTPGATTAAGKFFTLTLTADLNLCSICGFDPSSVLQWNFDFNSGTGLPQTTFYIAPNQAQARVPVDLYCSSTDNVIVLTAVPGGYRQVRVVVNGNNFVMSSATTGSDDLVVVTVAGTGFRSGAVALWNGAQIPTKFLSTTRIEATIPADAACPGTGTIAIVNPGPAGGTSNVLPFNVENPVPSINSLSPNPFTAGSGDATMTVSGGSFVPNSTVQWNGSPLASTYFSSTRIQALVPSALLSNSGFAVVAVASAGPGGGQTDGLLVPITSPPPSLGSISPASTILGQGDLTLTVNGSGYTADSRVFWNDAQLASNLVNTNQVTATVPAAYLAAVGSADVKIVTPGPGGGQSNSLNFAILYPAPVLTGISPSTAAAGSSNFLLTVSGSSFLVNSTVTWNDTPLATSLIGSGQVQAVVPAEYLTATGTAGVKVVNPGPGGGVTAAEPFTITAALIPDNPVPALIGVSPTNARVGDAPFTMIITGTNFVPNEILTWGGVPYPSFVVSSTRITVPVTALSTGGLNNLTVFNPAPGGGASNSLIFTVTNSLPTLTSLSPNTFDAGFGLFGMGITIEGTNLSPGTIALWNGEAIPTQLNGTFVYIPPDKMASGSVYQLSLLNSLPGGGTSNSLPVTVTNPAQSIFGLNQTVATAGVDTTLQLYGNNYFVPDARIQVNGEDVPSQITGFNTTLQATVPGDLMVAGTLTVTVFAPSPGGGQTNPLTMTVKQPVPSITYLDPANPIATSAAFSLTVIGNQFNPGASVLWNSSPLETTYLDSTHLQAAVPEFFAATPYIVSVSVKNSDPTDGPSPTFPLPITYTMPVISGISPPSLPYQSSGGCGDCPGGGSYVLTVSGLNFTPSSLIRWNERFTPINFISSTLITTTILGGVYLSTAGVVSVTVENYLNGTDDHLTSNIQRFPVTEFSRNQQVITFAPLADRSVIDSSFVVSATSDSGLPVSFAAYGVCTLSNEYTITLTGVAGSCQVSAGQAGDVLYNPAPDVTRIFAVNNLAPSLSSLSPSTLSALGPTSTLTLTGTNFVTGSTVKLNNLTVPSGFVSSTRLTATVPAGTLTSSGTISVTVANPLPGGAVSTPQFLSVTNPAPAVSAVSPITVSASAPTTTLRVMGSNYVSGAEILWNGVPLSTTVVGSNLLRAKVPPANLRTGGTVTVTVSNPGPGGGISNGRILSITNPLPAISAHSPLQVSAGSPGASLVVTGTRFVTGSVVLWNGVGLATQGISTVLTGTVPSDKLTNGAFITIAVFNPGPGGGTSDSQDLVVNNLVPNLSQINPIGLPALGPTSTLTVNGNQFAPGATLRWNGFPLSTTVLSAGQLTATLPAARIATGGLPQVVAVNPGPGGGVSTAQTFTVTNPAPVISGLSPLTATAFGPDFTVIVDGSSFVDGSGVQWNGIPLATSLVSQTRLAATVPAARIAAVGTATVTVVSPTPGGGPSNGKALPIENPIPALGAFSPVLALAGSGTLTVTVSGSRFVTDSVVLWNGGILTTTFVSSTQVKALVPAANLNTAGTATLAIRNPLPGGGSSTNLLFGINNPAPALSSVTPASLFSAGPDQVLTLNGSGFQGSSIVQWNGSVLTSTVVSSTQISAFLPAARIAAAGTATVTVFAPAPGGGLAEAKLITIHNPVPIISMTVPSLAIAQGDLPLAVDGRNFSSGAEIVLNQTPMSTGFVSAGRLTTTIPAETLTAAGILTLTVRNPGPGGGLSAPKTITITNPSPSVTTIGPNDAKALDPDLVIGVAGSHFVDTSTVLWNGAPLTTTFLGNSLLSAEVPGSLITSATTASVVVVNPAPGGGSSTPVSYSVVNPLPVLTVTSPVNTASLSPDFTLTVTGTKFIPGALVRWNDQDLATRFVSNSRLTATVPATNLRGSSIAQVTVVNPAPGGGSSGALGFTVLNAVPALGSLSQISVTAGSPDLVLTLNGSGFSANSGVKWGTDPLATGFISSTRLTATVPSAKFALAGVTNVVVNNPAPGGGDTGPIPFTVNNQVPVITVLGPDNYTASVHRTLTRQFTCEASNPDLLLTVTGTGLVRNSVIRWNGSDLHTLWDNGQLSAFVPGANLQTAGFVSVTVFAPAPGGGVSTPASFTIKNPVPTGNGFSPGNWIAGTAGGDLGVQGLNFPQSAQFAQDAVVQINGQSYPTRFEIRHSQTDFCENWLVATIPTSAVAASGNRILSVVNPAPGGGRFDFSFPYPVYAPEATLSRITPNSITVPGSDTAVTVDGTNFVLNSQVQLNGVAVPSTFISTTRISATVPSSLLTIGSNSAIRVVNFLTAVFMPDFGRYIPTNTSAEGKPSNPQALTLFNPKPSIAQVSPATVTALGPDFTLTMDGSNFVPGAIIFWNGTALSTTRVSSSRLTATVPAANRAPGGSVASVTMTNPDPVLGQATATTVTVLNEAPDLTSVSPASTTALGPNLTLTVNGSKFVPGAVFSWEGVDLTTTFVSSTRLTVGLPADRLAPKGGTKTIQVRNPTPGGGATSSSYTVNNPLPQLTSLSQTQLVSGDQTFTLTLNGQDFTSNAVAQWNGQALATTYVNSTRLDASIPASFMNGTGSASINAFNPSPAGGQSNSVSLPIITGVCSQSTWTFQTSSNRTVQLTNLRRNSSLTAESLFGHCSMTGDLTVKIPQTDLTIPVTVSVEGESVRVTPTDPSNRPLKLNLSTWSLVLSEATISDDGLIGTAQSWLAPPTAYFGNQPANTAIKARIGTDGLTLYTLNGDGSKNFNVPFPDHDIGGRSLSRLVMAVRLIPGTQTYALDIAGYFTASLYFAPSPLTYFEETRTSDGKITGQTDDLILNFGLKLWLFNPQIVDGKITVQQAGFKAPGGEPILNTNPPAAKKSQLTKLQAAYNAAPGLGSTVYNVVIDNTNASLTIGNGEFDLPDLTFSNRLRLVGLRGLLNVNRTAGRGYLLSATGAFVTPFAQSQKSGGSISGVSVNVTFSWDGQGQALTEFESLPGETMPLEALDPGAATNGSNLNAAGYNAGTSFALNSQIPLTGSGMTITRFTGSAALRDGLQDLILNLSLTSQAQRTGSPILTTDTLASFKSLDNWNTWKADLDGSFRLLIFSVNQRAQIVHTTANEALNLDLSYHASQWDGILSFSIESSDQAIRLSGTAHVTVGLRAGDILDQSNPPANCSWVSSSTALCASSMKIPAVDVALDTYGTIGTFRDSSNSNNTVYGFKGTTRYRGYDVGYFYDAGAGIFYLTNTSRFLSLQGADIQAAAEAFESGKSLGASGIDPKSGAKLSFQGLRTLDVTSNLPYQADTIFVLGGTGNVPGLSLVKPDGTVISSNNLPDNVDRTESNTNTSSDVDTGATGSSGLRVASPSTSGVRKLGLQEVGVSTAKVRLALSIPQLTAADVWIDGSLVYTNLLNSRVSAYRALPPGSHEILVVPNGQTGPPVISTTVDLITDTQTLVAAVGQLGTVQAVVAPDLRDAPGPSKSSIRLANFATGTAAETHPIDLLISGQVPLVEGLNYGELSSYVPIDAGLPITLVVRQSNAGPVLIRLPNVTPSEGGVATLFILTKVDGSGHQVVDAWLALEAEVLPVKQVQYFIHQAEPGDWQLRIESPDGNLSAKSSTFQIGGIFAAPGPRLTDVQVASTSPGKAEISWHLNSPDPATRISIYANRGDITRTTSLTNTFGELVTETVSLYTGTPVAVGINSNRDGQRQTYEVDLSTLGAGTYRFLVQADDNTNPPANVYTNDTVQVKNVLPLTWNPALSATAGFRSVTLNWSKSPSPDVDSYLIAVGTSPISADQVVTVGNVISWTLTGLEAGQTYYLSVGAHDQASGQISQSPLVTATTGTADYSIVAGQPLWALAAGGYVVAEARLSTNSDPFPDAVALSAGVLPDGFSVSLPEGLVVPTVLGARVPITITASESVVSGTHEIPIQAFGAAVQHNLVLTVEVSSNQSPFQVRLLRIYKSVSLARVFPDGSFDQVVESRKETGW